MPEIELPELPKLNVQDSIPYESIRYICGYAESTVHRLMQDYARAAVLADRAGRECVVVPVEPTEAMLDKGAMQIAMNHQRVQTAKRAAEHVYRAMLAARPVDQDAALYTRGDGK